MFVQKPEQHIHERRGDEGAEQHTENREQSHRQQVAPQAPRRDIIGAFEEQDRQEDDQDQVGGQLQIAKAGLEAQQTGYNQRDGIVLPRPPCEKGDGKDDQHQHEYHLDCRMERIRPMAPPLLLACRRSPPVNRR